MATDKASRTEADAAAFERVTAEPDTWPAGLGDRPRGWNVYDEVPDRSDLEP